VGFFWFLISVLLMVTFFLLQGVFICMRDSLSLSLSLLFKAFDYSLLCPIGVIGAVVFVWSIVSRFSVYTVLHLLLMIVMQNLTSAHGKDSVF
jgi:hypothetical protein